MLSTGISVNNIFKQLERAGKAYLKLIINMLKEARHSFAPAVTDEVVNKEVVIDKDSKLNIARTTMPDERLDFNQTFQYIRYGLEKFYKERNQNFDNFTSRQLPLKELNTAEKKRKTLKSTTQVNHDLAAFSREGSTILLHTAILPTGIAKTILPDERTGYNDTFLHIRYELDEFYKEKNPIFINTVASEEALTPKESEEREKYIEDYLKDENLLKVASTDTSTVTSLSIEDRLPVSKKNHLPAAENSSDNPDPRACVNTTSSTTINQLPLKKPFRHSHNQLLEKFFPGTYKNNLPGRNQKTKKAPLASSQCSRHPVNNASRGTTTGQLPNQARAS